MNSYSATYNQTRWVTVGYNATACPVVTNVSVTYQNIASQAGFTATYTNTTTSQGYTFSIPASGSGTLGTLPSGTYSLTISKTPQGVPWALLFGTGCQYLSGTYSAIFSNIVVSNCHHVTIDWEPF